MKRNERCLNLICRTISNNLTNMFAFFKGEKKEKGRKKNFLEEVGTGEGR